MLTCSFSVSHLIKHEKTPLWTQRCLTIEPPVWNHCEHHKLVAPPMRKHLKIIIWARSWPWPNRRMPQLPSLALYAVLRHFDAKERSFRHTWWGPQWEKPRFVVYLIHWQLRKLENEDWFQGIAVLVKEDKCQTESDCFCDDNWSTLHSWTINILQTPNSIPEFWITIYLDGS